MGNSAGVYGAIAALFRPGLLVPKVVVSDISELDWKALKKAGVSHLIFDKDNCITLPLQDSIVPELEEAWHECTNTGFTTVMIVSNSAGSSNDIMGIGAENLSRRLGQPVLAHPAKKPAMACAKQILDVLAERAAHSSSSTSSGHIAIIGDRVTTDIILASRIQRLLTKRKSSQEAIGILTTKVFGKERLGTRMMRGLEMRILARLTKMGILPGASWRRKRTTSMLPTDWQSIATAVPAMSTSPSLLEIAEEQSVPSADIPMSDRIRNVPSRISGLCYVAIARSFNWLGAGWHVIDDGLRLGTKGYIGTPDAALRRTRLGTDQMTSKYTSLSLSSTGRPTISKGAHSVNEFGRAGTRSMSTQQRPTVNIPPPHRLRGWSGAIAALVLVPTCWYGGVLLHEWQDQRNGKKVEVVKSSTHSNTPKSAGPPSLSPSVQQNQTLLSAKYHLQRELEDIDDKLHRLEQRARPKQTRV